MSTKWINIKGTIKWAKVYDPDVAFGTENWKVNLYPSDGKEWEKFQKTGLALKVREDDDGKYITLRRPTKKLIRDDLVIFMPPEITGKVQVTYKDTEGNKVRQYNKGDKTNVITEGDRVELGNGTEVIANFCYYDTSKGPGHRLEGLRVLELVEYVPVEKLEDDEVENKTITENVTTGDATSEQLDSAISPPSGNASDKKVPW